MSVRVTVFYCLIVSKIINVFHFSFDAFLLKKLKLFIQAKFT